MFASFLIRLCIVMVAAFGSRPCGVSVGEHPAPIFVGLRAVAEETLPARDPPSSKVESITRGTVAVRGSTTSSSGNATTPPADVATWPGVVSVATAQRTPIPRRTPCAACGDGGPYDATAPPMSPLPNAPSLS